jgi:hypothetical protein
MTSSPWKVMLLSALAMVGCGGVTTDAQEAQDAVDTTQSTSNEGALMDLASADDTAATSCSITSEDVAQAMTVGIGRRLNDSSCVTATRSGNAVDYVMNACTGKNGKVVITGTVHVVYTANADCSVDAVASGKGIEVNKAIIDLDATGHYTKDTNGLQKIVVSTHSKGGTANVQLDHSGNYTFTRDTADCRTLDGTWSTDWSAARGSATTSTVATGLKKCADACPVAGGKVVHDGFLGRVITLTFDGSAVAQWSSNKGKSGTINLDCTP